MTVNNTTINSPLLPGLLGSKLRANVLRFLFTHPDERYFIRQLASLVKDDPTNMGRELVRLEKMGIVVAAMEGKQKYYQANRKSPIFPELHGLIVKTAGLADVLREVLEPLSQQIFLAFVYGSMASGEATASSDVDLMVVGDVDEMALHSALSRGEDLLARPVNYILMSRLEFQKRRAEHGSFLSRVLSGPKVMILGSADEL